MINSTDLKSFLVTAHHLHLTKAAKALGLSQPALSHCIKRLEAEVKSSLFLRRKNGLILTESGEYLLLHGQRIMEDLLSVESFLVTGKSRESKTFNLGIHPSVGMYVLPQLLKQDLGMKLKFAFGLSREVTQMVQEGKIDCAVAINPHPHPNLIIAPLAEDQFTLWSPKAQTKTKTLFYDPNLEQSHSILRQLEKKNILFESLIEIPNLELISKALYEGAGSAILPARVVGNHIQWDKKIKLHSTEIKAFKDRICFVYSGENQYKDEMKALKNNIAHFLK